RLRREDRPSAVGVINQWLHAEPVADRQQSAVAGVPQYAREFAAEVFGEPVRVILVKVNQDFRVAASAEDVAAGFEVAADSLVVVELAVDCGENSAVLVRQGLLPGLGIHHREPSVADTNRAV